MSRACPPQRGTCPAVRTTEGHVPGAACTIYPSNQDFKKVAAKLGSVETAYAENAVSHWTFQRPGIQQRRW